MEPQALVKEADRCVKCGICLPHCPTYTLTLDEGDSPRGRISLIQALAAGSFDSPRLHEHLDRCLGCLACEKSCPSGVRYGKLIDGARQLQTSRPDKLRLINLLSEQPYRGWSRAGLWLYRAAGLGSLAKKVGGKKIQRLAGLLPPGARLGHWKSHYPTTQARGEVGLFTGCAARISDRLAIDAAIRVLNQLGLNVHLPSDQGCCGAMHQHSGDPNHASRLAEQNSLAFNAQRLDAVIFLASGCGAQLVEGLRNTLHARLFEISQFLLQHDWPEGISLGAIDGSVTLHTPCTLRNQLGLAEAPAELLGRIPGLSLQHLNRNGCCGAAGHYLLDQPDMSDRLRGQMQDPWLNQPSRYLATSNTGCALHLAAGIRQAGVDSQVVHPIELIAKSLGITV